VIGNILLYWRVIVQVGSGDGYVELQHFTRDSRADGHGSLPLFVSKATIGACAT
jgi:hypothetical protein